MKEEALACRTGAALFNMSYFAKFYLTGPDAQIAANWLFTANTEKEAEKVTYTCMLNSKGGVEADVTVTGLNEGVGTLIGPILKVSCDTPNQGSVKWKVFSRSRKTPRVKMFHKTRHVAHQIGVLWVGKSPESLQILFFRVKVFT